MDVKECQRAHESCKGRCGLGKESRVNTAGAPLRPYSSQVHRQSRFYVTFSNGIEPLEAPPSLSCIAS